MYGGEIVLRRKPKKQQTIYIPYCIFLESKILLAFTQNGHVSKDNISTGLFCIYVLICSCTAVLSYSPAIFFINFAFPALKKSLNNPPLLPPLLLLLFSYNMVDEVRVPVVPGRLVAVSDGSTGSMEKDDTDVVFMKIMTSCRVIAVKVTTCKDRRHIPIILKRTDGCDGIIFMCFRKYSIKMRYLL